MNAALKVLQLVIPPFVCFCIRDRIMERYTGRKPLGWRYNLFVTMFVLTTVFFLLWFVKWCFA